MATIKGASIGPGIADRGEHLRTADFFDAKKIPTPTFQSTRIEGKDGLYVMHGTLTLPGVSKGVARPFAVTLRKLGEGKKGTTVNGGFILRTTLNRRDYGMVWERRAVADFVGDETEVEIDATPMPTLLTPR
ncbi:MAG: YceI family protein [Opitutae bacterium]|nr:YceI family protein [Opitutae bacterium]